MENHNYNKIQQEKLERKHLINFFGQLTLRDRVKFLAVSYLWKKSNFRTLGGDKSFLAKQQSCIS